MTIIPFPTLTVPTELPAIECTAAQIYTLLDIRPNAAILFVDETCRAYLATNMDWLGKYAVGVIANPETTEFFRICSSPTWIWFQNRIEVARLSGACPEDKIMQVSADLKDRNWGARP